MSTVLVDVGITRDGITFVLPSGHPVYSDRLAARKVYVSVEDDMTGEGYLAKMGEHSWKALGCILTGLLPEQVSTIVFRERAKDRAWRYEATGPDAA